MSVIGLSLPRPIEKQSTHQAWLEWLSKYALNRNGPHWIWNPPPVMQAPQNEHGPSTDFLF